jgi:hypothetical protein
MSRYHGNDLAMPSYRSTVVSHEERMSMGGRVEPLTVFYLVILLLPVPRLPTRAVSADLAPKGSAACHNACGLEQICFRS